MKRWNVVAVMCLLVAGCIPTEEQMLDLGNDVDLLMEKIDDQQSKLIAQIDKVQDHVTIVNEAVKAASTLSEKAAAGIEASRPFNPYADEMAAGLGLITLFGGLFATKKINTLSRKRKADEQGRERTLRKLAVLADSEVTAARVKEMMYENIGVARAANRV